MYMLTTNIHQKHVCNPQTWTIKHPNAAERTTDLEKWSAEGPSKGVWGRQNGPLGVTWRPQNTPISTKARGLDKERLEDLILAPPTHAQDRQKHEFRQRHPSKIKDSRLRLSSSEKYSKKVSETLSEDVFLVPKQFHGA